MFSTLISMLALTSLVLAAPQSSYTSTYSQTNSGQCNLDYQYCCESSTLYADASSISSSLPNNLVGVVAGIAGKTLSIGQGCSPVANIIGQSSACSNQQLCCEGNTYNGGLIVLGCSPITA